MATKICFVSDLHMFSERSNSDRYSEQLQSAAHRSDLFIFGGDIFDFKWSKFQTIAKAIENSVSWLQEFISRFPTTKFCYLIGNHDCIADFVSELEKLQNDNLLQLEHYYLRQHETVFLHGDVIDTDGTQAELERYRSRWQHGVPTGKWMNRAYNAAVGCGLHRVAARRLNPPKRVGKNLCRYLNDINQWSGTKNVVYGHTHWANDFMWDGVQFRNCGAAIKGLTFEPIEIQVDR